MNNTYLPDRKILHLAVLCAVGIYGIVAMNADAAVSAIRSIDGTAVTIAVDPDTDAGSYAVEEQFPEGATPSDISNEGYWNANTRRLRWGPYYDTVVRNFSYTLNGVPNRGYYVSGMVSVDGIDYSIEGSYYVYVPIPPEGEPEGEGEPPPDHSAVRSYSNNRVTVTVDPDASTVAYALQENIPVGLIVVGINFSGAYDPARQQVRWGPFYDNTVRDFNYTVTGEPGRYYPSGSASFDGLDIPVTGSTSIYVTEIEGEGEPIEGEPEGEGELEGEGEPLPTHEAVRTVTDDYNVEVLVTPDSGTAAYALEEALPQGILPVDINEEGVWDEARRHVRWGPFFDDSQRSFNYRCSGENGGYYLSGTASFDGYDIPITGSSYVYVYKPSAQANRTINGRNVSITLAPDPGVGMYLLEESLPEGLEPASYDADANWDDINRKIKWGPYTDEMVHLLSYSVTGDPGTYTVTGTISVDGDSVPVTGPDQINITEEGEGESPFGSLHVTINPYQAVAAGASWRRVGTTTWFGNDVTESNVPVGEQQVQFSTVTGWVTPSTQTATIQGGQTYNLVATYTVPEGEGEPPEGEGEPPLFGSLHVTLLPTAAVAAGAHWRRAGTSTWYDSDFTESNIPIGAYQVEYLDLDGWVTPSPDTVQIVGEQVANLVATYTEPQGEGEGETPEGEPREGETPEGEPSEGEIPEGEPSEGETPEGEPSEGETPEGEGEIPEGEPREGETPEGEPSEGETPEGEPREGETPEGEPSEGETPEGEPREGETPEGEPREGETPEGETREGETSSVEEQLLDGLLDGITDENDDGGLNLIEAQNIIPGLTEEQFLQMDENDDSILDVCELGGDPEISVKGLMVVITCNDYESAHEKIAETFAGVTVNCAGSTIEVREFAAENHNGDPIEYDLNEIAASILDVDEYDKSVGMTRELFHKYFLFKGGKYSLVYKTKNSESVEQTITIQADCRGCLGCYSCDSCANSRPIPEYVMDYKQLVSNLLLVGLSVMTLLAAKEIQ